MINIMQSLRSESNILMTSANLSKFNVRTYFITVRYNDCDCDALLSICENFQPLDSLFAAIGTEKQ